MFRYEQKIVLEKLMDFYYTKLNSLCKIKVCQMQYLHYLLKFNSQ